MHRAHWITAAAVSPAFALPTATFDFEDLDPGPVAPSGLSLTSNGLTLDIDPGVNALSIETAPGGRPASWGDRQLNVRSSDPTLLSPITLTFSEGVTGFRIEFGDDDPDIDRVVLNVFGGPDATGPTLFSDLISYRDTFPTTGTALFSFLAPTDAIRSITIDTSSTTGGLPTLFYDNLVVFIPAPGTGAALGLVGLALTRRRRPAA
jgi:hypothetical protein